MWQPMATAPRDQTEILLLTNTGIVSAWWSPPKVITRSYFDGEDMRGCEWVCYDDKFAIQVEWERTDEGEDKFLDGNAGILRWMPIPQT